jgi:hypothetical protein
LGLFLKSFNHPRLPQQRVVKGDQDATQTKHPVKMASLTNFVTICQFFLYCSLSSAYTLQSNYDYTNWYQSFDWQDVSFSSLIKVPFLQLTILQGTDPTHGSVDYISLADAQSSGLTKIIGNQVFMGVDNTTVIPTSSSDGRKSNWITSKTAFTHGLLIGDFAHIPGSDCGSWPGL